MNARHTIAALALIGTVALAGCASSQPTPEAETPATSPSAASDPNVTACAYLLGGVFDDTTTFAGTYMGDREAADPADLAPILEDWGTVQGMATGDLAVAADNLVGELEAIDQRYNGGDPLTPVDYQLISDSMNDALDACEVAIGTDG